MNQPSNRIATLIYGYLAGGLGEADKAELQAWLDASEENRLVFRELTDTKQLETATAVYAAFENNKRAAWAKLPGEERTERGATFMPNWKKLVAAAALVLLFAGGAWWWNYQRKGEAVVAKKEIPIKTDIAPGHEGAVLKLAGGKVIVLDSVADGDLATQGNTKVVLNKGQLSYDAHRAMSSKSMVYNELSTPRGRKFQLTLPDGSKVWLNAVSSIRYPVEFVGSERRVEVTGEAYFDVAHNVEKPFIVAMAEGGIKKAEVRVLGTRFNINSYEDENALVTTLLDGSVQFSNTGSNTLLQPGQEIQLSKTGTTRIIKEVNTALTIAWKNEMFAFQNADIKAIMRQVSRWYNVEVEYRADISEHYDCLLPRNLPVSKILQLLETIGGVHFEVDGSKVIVTK